MEIKSLGKTDLGAIISAFGKAFSDYDIQLSTSELRTMWKRRGFEPVSGDITQIAVNKPFRRKGIASLLLQEVSKLNKNPKTKLINAETTCTSIVAFLKSKNIGISGKQFEMIKEI